MQPLAMVKGGNHIRQSIMLLLVHS